MGQIIRPTDNKIEGPWLIDSKGLEELNDNLIEIENKLNEAFNDLVVITAESQIKEFKRRGSNIDLEQAKSEILRSHLFGKSKKYVLITTKQGKKIKEDNLLSLLKDSQIDEFHPTELRIQLEKGPCEFTLTFSSNTWNEALETRTRGLDDGTFNDVNYEINKWAEKHKQNIVVQKWCSWFPLATFLLLLVLFLLTPFFLKTRGNLYKTQLTLESNLLLKDGLDEKEIPKAIELILKRESGYVPENFNPNSAINQTLVKIWLLTLISLGILGIKPRTVIGLGKNKWKVEFYRKWIYFVLIFIPLSIVLPLFLSKLQ